jgi:hypothetical protein
MNKKLLLAFAICLANAAPCFAAGWGDKDATDKIKGSPEEVSVGKELRSPTVLSTTKAAPTSELVNCALRVSNLKGLLAALRGQPLEIDATDIVFSIPSLSSNGDLKDCSDLRADLQGQLKVELAGKR